MLQHRNLALSLALACVVALNTSAWAGNGLTVTQSVPVLCDQRGGGREVDISPDGLHVYVLGYAIVGTACVDQVAIEARDPLTGALSPAGAITLPGYCGYHSDVRVSPDGANVYVLEYYNPGRVYVYSRDSMSGGLTLLETHEDGTGGESLLSLAVDIALSADGAHAYVTSPEGITVYARSPLTGAL